jgi:hypothetical protein
LRVREQAAFGVGTTIATAARGVTVSEHEVHVHFHRRAHLPIISVSGILKSPVNVPWWNHRTLSMSV